MHVRVEQVRREVYFHIPGAGRIQGPLPDLQAPGRRESATRPPYIPQDQVVMTPAPIFPKETNSYNLTPVYKRVNLTP